MLSVRASNITGGSGPIPTTFTTGVPTVNVTGDKFVTTFVPARSHSVNSIDSSGI